MAPLELDSICLGDDLGELPSPCEHLVPLIEPSLFFLGCLRHQDDLLLWLLSLDILDGLLLLHINCHQLSVLCLCTTFLINSFVNGSSRVGIVSA